MGLKFNQKQKTGWAILSSRNKTRILFDGGSRSGKTALIAEYLVRRALQYPFSRQLAARKCRSHAKTSLWCDTLKKYLVRFIPTRFYTLSESELSIRFCNGSEILVAGLDDAERSEKVLGNEFITVFLNEATQFSWETVQMAATRLAQKAWDAKGRQAIPKLILDCNPRGPRHWLHAVGVRQIDPESGKELSDKANWARLPWSAFDNQENLPKEYLEGLAALPEIMKKRMFRMLCVVLALALLAPNVFAATPAPEVPLADEATVTRVKNEIATGEITDMEDLFLVAYQHLGADLEEEGMTAYVNEDGTLGFTQIISTNSGMARSDNATDVVFAVSTLAIIDDTGAVVTGVQFSPGAGYDSETVAGTNIYVAHTAYYNGRGDVLDYGSNAEIRLNYMVTNISGAGSTHNVVKLVQRYTHKNDLGLVDEQDSRTLTGVSNGGYAFTPSPRSWHRIGVIGAIETYAELTISGVANVITLYTKFSHFDLDGYV